MLNHHHYLNLTSMPRHIYILTHPPVALCYGSVQKHKKNVGEYRSYTTRYHLKQFLWKEYDNIHSYSAHGIEMQCVHIVISIQHDNTDTLMIALYKSR
jgi:hypothetical protein